MNEMQVLKYIALLTGLYLAIIVITQVLPQASWAKEMCYANENRRYDKVWHATCLHDGLDYNCELPKYQTDVMGWQDHMKRAKECDK